MNNTLKNIITKSTAVFAIAFMAFGAQAKDISQDELTKQLKGNNKPVVIDVRTAGEFADGHVPGAINIPHSEMKKRMGEIINLKDKDIVLYCRSGKRAGIAKDILAAGGFSKLNHLDGDFNAWSANKMPMEKGGKKTMKKVANPCGF
jgi:rhodanese-related sulfurtransferase